MIYSNSMNKLIIQVVSDIHLEFSNSYPKIKPLAKYLFLAGDIGTIYNQQDLKVKNFLSYCSLNWEKIFYVLGNHEFYQTEEFAHQKTSFEELELKYKHICSEFTNLYLLDNSFQEIEPGINVYGTTLWTSHEISNKNFMMLGETSNYGCETRIEDVLSDFNMIAIKPQNNSKYNISLNKEYINSKSKMQLEELEKYLNSLNPNKKSIILTHFPPIRNGSSNPIYSSQHEYLTNYFSWNNIYSKLSMSNVVGWISGHTHWSYDLDIDNIKFISNQMGYKNEFLKGDTNFEPDKIFEINSVLK
jgi:predicted MPP superfamily phosphohydrolase